MVNDAPLVSIIIPTFNRQEKLYNCLKGIENSDYKNVEVIVINDSNIRLPKYSIKNLKIKFIQHKKETFWVRCRNEGALKASGKLLFFVDDDNVLAPAAIGLLVRKYIALKGVGLLGPIMYGVNGNLWFYGAKANWINPYPKPVDKSEISKKELIETDVIPNAYMISKRLYVKIGMEDQNFLHHDDFDLAQRLKLTGYHNYIYTKAKTVHDFGFMKTRINELRVYAVIKGHIMLEKKYAPKLNYLLFVLIFIPVNTLYYFLYKIPTSRNPKKIKLYTKYLRGIKDGFKYKVVKAKNSKHNLSY